MSTIYSVDGKHLSLAECDKIALEQSGIVQGGFGYGYACPKGGRINREYDSKVIDSRGMGNHGAILLVGLTSRARGLIREGKIRKLIADGCPQHIAAKAVFMPRGMETEVWKFAEIFINYWPQGQVKIPQDFSRRALWKWFGYPIETNLSFPRQWAALELAQKVMFG